MRIETANEYVDFTFWHKPGGGGGEGDGASYDQPTITYFFTIFWNSGRGKERGIQRVALAIVIPAVYLVL